MRTQHSPAPWSIDKDRDQQSDVVRDASGFALAHLQHWVRAEHDANLKLVASAPEMCDGLMRIAAWIDGMVTIPAGTTEAIREKIASLLKSAGVAALLLAFAGCQSDLRYHAEYRADASRPAEGVIVAGVSGQILRR